jgi:two-component system phosphate regulon sensor histidine kinase PhoR
METIGFPGSVPSAPPASWDMQRIDNVASRDTQEADSDFAATLLAMAGHDLRQPLQVITSAHDILGKILHTDEQREELTRAGNATAQLSSMLGQLVEALQLRERSSDDLHLPVSMRPILDDLAAEFAKSARLKGITFRVASGDGAALSHPVLLTGMMRNLIRNAIDYTPPGGGVFVTSRRYGSELRIEARDTGCGIPADALSSIFDAFQRADESRTDGLGLGLFIVKHAADLLGHRIEVRSVEGRGSCFTVVTRAARRSARRQSEMRRGCRACLSIGGLSQRPPELPGGRADDLTEMACQVALIRESRGKCDR